MSGPDEAHADDCDSHWGFCGHVDRLGTKMNKLTVFLAALAAGCVAPMANAAIQISYNVGANAPVVCGNNPVSSGPATCNAVSSGGVTILNISASSNSPGTAALAQQLRQLV